MDSLTRIGLTKVSRDPIVDPIAELAFFVAFPDGRREPQQFKLGRPIVIGGFDVCPVESVGPMRVSTPCVGSYSFHALMMAIAGLRATIGDFVKKNDCELYFRDGSPLTLEHLFKIHFADALFDDDECIDAQSCTPPQS